ncbi:hypothetical protein PoB_001878500 [Plakobranchus ocellatus]|uniref:Uncharacterized protein n=1 Tax=Plakobranchus ocellatus TaxID=259542 RepID=A0AAV3ZAV5_9GAST|nr:hypothetical protein PoB_001878500 [Plakobranchus ocellatus]
MSSPALAKVRGKNRGPNTHVPQRTKTLPTNMMTVLSRIKVDMPLNSSGPRNKWGKRRAGSSRYSFMSHNSQDSTASKQPDILSKNPSTAAASKKPCSDI